MLSLVFINHPRAYLIQVFIHHPRTDLRRSLILLIHMVLEIKTPMIGSAGTISPVYRCFAALSFKPLIKWINNHTKVFNAETN
uniref:Uncharacterized protein n=1 Tax=Tanacetum cinerariifolium TaxID=118510 RepID=A0A6L2JN09_TANCI|nr:hypothetical protein CTI12_AA349980 [Tanacetum cinerariifolium]